MFFNCVIFVRLNKRKSQIKLFKNKTKSNNKTKKANIRLGMKAQTM